MPVVSSFSGIRIRINHEVGGKHSEPHFHAYYGSDIAIFSIVTIEMLDCTNNFPARIEADIKAWAREHRRKLKKNWYRIKYMKPAIRI